MDYKTILNYLNLNREIILTMLKREEEIRKSPEYITKCDLASNITNKWLEITDTMQKELVKEFGFVDILSNTLAVQILRSATLIYPDDLIIKNSVVHFRENIANKGNIKIGDDIKDISLHTLQSESINLLDILDSDKPNILLVGSHT